MNLYLISQNVNADYDTYDSAVVAAESEHEAQRTLPSDSEKWGDQPWSAWAKDPSEVKVTYLGVAKEGTTAGVILASFNAG